MQFLKRSILSYFQRRSYLTTEKIWESVSKEYALDPKWVSGSSIKDSDVSAIATMYQAFYSALHTVPNQRLTVHNIFLTIHTLFASIFGYMLIQNHSIWIEWSFRERFWMLIIPYFLLIVFCVIWYKILQEYSMLNTFLMMVTRGLENYLPAKPLSTFFSVMTLTNRNYDLGTLMKSLPILFIFLYIAAFYYMLYA